LFKKHRNIYLFLTLACFIGIILVFVFDGYMGLYDSLTVTSTGFPQEITPEQWGDQGRNGGAPVFIDANGEMSFSYQVDNRRFFPYRADVDVSLWYNQSKLADLASETISLGAFGGGQVDWTLDVVAYVPENLPANSTLDFTILIKRGEIERRVIFYYNTSIPPKPVILPQS